MTDTDIDDRLREQFAILLRRSPADTDAALQAVDGHLRRRRRRRTATRAGLTLAVVSILIGTLGTLLARDNSGQRVVTSPTPTPTSPAQPVELLTIGWQEGPRIADPATGNTSPIGPALQCNTCMIVRAGDKLFTAQDGRLYSFTAGDGTLREIGAADAVFPTTAGDALFVSVGGVLEKRSVDGEPIDGPWTLPAGYHLTEQPHAVSNGLIITNKDAFIGDLAWWDPSTGEIHQLGRYNQFIDVHTDTEGADTLAWTVCPTNEFPCSLVISDNTDSSRTIDPPVTGNGFYLGGAFSPDGTTLATTISMHPGTNDPDAALALIDVATGDPTVITESRFGVGEPYGYVAWSPDGSTVFFTGDDGVQSFNVLTHDLTELNFPGTYYSVGVVAGVDRSHQCPNTAHPWQVGPGSSDESGDGLPPSGTATGAAAQAALSDASESYDAQNAYVRAEPGRTWNETSDGTVEIVPETVYTVVLELRSENQCPEAPAIFNGVPLTFLAGDS